MVFAAKRRQSWMKNLITSWGYDMTEVPDGMENNSAMYICRIPNVVDAWKVVF